MPYYIASPEEVRNVVEREGSFLIEYMQPFALDSVADVTGDDMKGERMAKNIRNYTESMISHHFGEEIIDRIYDKLPHIIVEDIKKESPKIISIVVVLNRNID